MAKLQAGERFEMPVGARRVNLETETVMFERQPADDLADAEDG